MKSLADRIDTLCTNCGTIHVISRRVCHKEKPNYRLYLWCFKCQKPVEHIEIVDKTTYLMKLQNKPNLNKEEKNILDLLEKRR